MAERNSDVPPTLTTKPVTVDEDSDPDFDDLDDVLDQFSSADSQPQSQSNVQPSQPSPGASGPGRPSSSSEKISSAAPPPPIDPTKLAESEDEFMALLASEMSSVLGNLKADPSASSTSADDISKMGSELDDFTSAMEKQGVKPEDLLKAILGEAAVTGLQPANTNTTTTTTSKAATSNQKPVKIDSTSGEKESFEETIRRTMQRMEASDSNATTAAATNPAETSNSEEDMLATLLQAMESSAGSGSGDPNAADSEDPLSKMFLGMMEQLTNKDMLYEPMKELDSKYPEWLVTNKGKLPADDYKRYAGQRGVVREIVSKFEEKDYSDEDSRCREFIWERMQKMQGMGSPPEDLIANPIPGMMGGKEDDVGCPPQ